MKNTELLVLHSKLILVSCLKLPEFVKNLILDRLSGSCDHDLIAQVLKILAVSLLWKFNVFDFAVFVLAV
jgi:hypothetical protein